MEKITNVMALQMAIEALSIEGSEFPTEALEKLGNIKSSYAKKSGSVKKPTATQIANEGIKVEIVDLLSDEPTRLFSATEIAKALSSEERELSVSKISALLTALLKAGMVERVEDKRKAFYKSVA